MTFSEFAKIMYPFIGTGQNKGDFVPYLLSLVMEEPSVANNRINDIDNDGILSRVKPDTYARYFNGKKAFPQKLASQILNRLDTSSFVDVVNDLPIDSYMSLQESIKSYTNNRINSELASACANLFTEILHNCANKPRQSKSSQNAIWSVPHQWPFPPESYLQMKRDRKAQNIPMPYDDNYD